ncbi:MAG: HupE/UreJ family protein [Rubrivivax sp.]|jgi:urease accessory protein|nr:HupE/UreJ family protein [Rubrivivax sp.]MDP3224828.1 HupE/UreJ family protein [Rubrivivax sp.]
MNKLPLRGVAALALIGFAGTAAAHTGHGGESFFAGLAHPFGADHLLAMLAVGLWSVFALPTARAWMGPAAFMAALLVGAAAGAAGAFGPLVEVAIACSVVVLGAMLVVARRMPPALGLGLVALAATLHGLAHGAEAPQAAGWAGYATGFLLTTAALHFGGLFTGLAMRRAFTARAAQLAGGLGLACGGAGLYLLSQF